MVAAMDSLPADERRIMLPPDNQPASSGAASLLFCFAAADGAVTFV
jgi:hypothetical protein